VNVTQRSGISVLTSPTGLTSELRKSSLKPGQQGSGPAEFNSIPVPGEGNGWNPAVAGGVYEVTFDENDPANPVFSLAEQVPCSVRARFVCDNGHTTFGTSMYVLGNISELGTWIAERAVKLAPDGPYPRLTGVVNNLPPDTKIEWKCVKRLESGEPVLEWEGGIRRVPVRGWISGQESPKGGVNMKF